MEPLSPFLVGGPAYSGTTLLALLCNGPGSVCLDEPDFEKPEQAHRGLPVLQRLCPDAVLPAAPTRALTLAESFDLSRECAAAVRPAIFGFKTCNDTFISYARLFRDAGLPVIAIVRDVRDTLVGPLPTWMTEESLVGRYRRVWNHLWLTSAWVRYEDLVRHPRTTLATISAALGVESLDRTSWDPDEVPAAMLKNERHELLYSGALTADRVGIWRDSGRSFGSVAHETAELMGYDP